MWQTLGLSFLVLFLAELADKTQLTLIALAARHPPAPLLGGALAGFAVMTAVAVALGTAGSQFLPTDLIRYLSAALFILIGAWLLLKLARRNEEEGETPASPNKGRGAFLAAFGATLLLELGDKTQLATVTLAANYAPLWAVFLGSFAALAAVSTLGVYGGAFIAARLRRRWIETGSAVLFILIGLALLVFE